LFQSAYIDSMHTLSIAILTRASIATFLIATAASGQSPPVLNWDLADAQTVRLAPEKIGALPLGVRRELARLGCTVPQVWAVDKPGNFVTGRFSSSSREDIAVLCSRNRISSILVFGQAEKPIAELAEAPDKNYLQDVGNGRIGFSRLLEVAPPERIRRYDASYGGPELPPLDHDGVEESFLEKASIVWYWHAGSWLQLTGAD